MKIRLAIMGLVAFAAVGARAETRAECLARCELADTHLREACDLQYTSLADRLDCYSLVENITKRCKGNCPQE